MQGGLVMIRALGQDGNWAPLYPCVSLRGAVDRLDPPDSPVLPCVYVNMNFRNQIEAFYHFPSIRDMFLFGQLFFLSVNIIGHFLNAPKPIFPGINTNTGC